MGYANLAACVADLEKNGQLTRIDTPIDPFLEMAALQRRAFANRAPALLFTHPVGCSFPMLANLFGTTERVNYIFRDALPAIKRLFEALDNPANLLKSPLKSLGALTGLFNLLPARPAAWETKTKAPVLEKQCALRDLPKLVSWPEDGGPFITLPLVYSEDSRGNANLGMYRIQLGGNEYGEDEIGLHYQLKRGIGIHHAEALAMGRELPVQVYVGGPPALTLASIMPLPEGMSEILFAGLLGGRRLRIDNVPNMALPVIAECDFMIQGRICKGVKPEGPFGDHMGYYSLKHDFPVIRVESVRHRENAIWPFTSVGRPPQEDTVFGGIIHELTRPLVSGVFKGVREVHAVDAAGVHPLLLAIGEERYTPYELSPKPRELLTLAFNLLGVTQTSLAKYLLIAAASPGLSTQNVAAFFRHVLERTDFSRDLHFIGGSTCDTLDYSGTALNEGSKLIWACAGDRKRELGVELKDFPDLAGFRNPRMVEAGIIALEGPKHALQRGVPDPVLEAVLGNSLAQWPRRENFPLLALVDDADFCAASFDNFLWTVFTRSDPATDVYGTHGKTFARHWSCEPPLIIDSRKKYFHAPVLEDDPAVIRRLENLAVSGGPLEGIF